jgi:predicted nucleic acid-binding Zn ribbon protein
VTPPGGPPKRPRASSAYRPPRALEPRSAAAAVGAALAFRGITDEIRASRLLTEWTDLVGPKISARTRPSGVYDRVLVVEVASSAWLQELNLLRAQIFSGLIDRLGEPRLFDELRFKLASGRGTALPRKPAPRAAPPPRPTTPPATGLAREQIIRDTEKVDDAELRELIARVRIANNR